MHTILKANWERYRLPIKLSLLELRTLIAPVCSDVIDNFVLFSDGCANTNYRIKFIGEAPLVLRIYTREASSLRLEQDIHQRIGRKIPVAKMLFADDSRKNCPYPYAVLSYVDGLLLRDLIFQRQSDALLPCYAEAGRFLALFSSITFAEGGFFEPGLEIRPFAQKDAYLNFARSLLRSSSLKRDWGIDLVKRISSLVENAQEWPKTSCAHLTHGDFDPSNIKVKNETGVWRISGILDWEFAYAGTYFSDIGQMMRYSHKLPKSYEEAFMSGVRQGGLELLPSWKRCAKLVDMLNLLHLSHSNPKHVRPFLNNDAQELVTHTVDNWETY